MSKDIFSNQILLELTWFVLIYLNRNNNVKQLNARNCYLEKGKIKNYIIIINGTNFHDQAVDCDTKR